MMPDRWGELWGKSRLARQLDFVILGVATWRRDAERPPRDHAGFVLNTDDLAAAAGHRADLAWRRPLP
jgi:hypothetical protein